MGNMKKKASPVTLESLNDKMESLSFQIAKIGMKCEELDTKFRFLMEGFGSLDKRIEALENYTKERFDEMDYKFEVVFKKLDDMEITLNKGIRLR
jgi:hypothetical protein